MIHFELIFVKGVRSVSRFIFLQVNVQLFQQRLLKRPSIPHYIAFASLLEMSCGSISGLCILLL